MYCKHCGAVQDDNSAVCTNCNAQLKDDGAQQGQQGQTYQQAPPAAPQQPPSDSPYHNPPAQQVYYQQPPQQAVINNWLVPNIVIAVLSMCCCQMGIITGIIGIVFAAMVNGKQQQGDIAGAQKNANVAKMLFFVSLALIIITFIIGIILLATGVLFEYMDSYQQYLY